jgi:4-amino-4-deoxy-L-arabinose transferase-like glycosyltransferase
MEQGSAGRDLLSSSELTEGSQHTAVPVAEGSSGAGTLPVTGRPGAKSSRWERVKASAWLPLAAVLAVQAALSVRLIGADTAFQDEGTYLWAGHLEWAHVLHGAPLPPFPIYFSGAPVIYPPLGALADSVGGLAGARLLSMVFMLGCTILVWDVTRRLFDRRAAFFAAALFATLAPTLHLGSFATYDAMSLFLLALATWLVASAGERGEATGRMIAAGVVLALANSTAYSTALFDPVVLAMAVFVAWPAGRRVAARRGAVLVTATLVLLAVGVLFGGGRYLTGIRQTTLQRAPGSDASLTVLLHAWSWTGVVIVLALSAVFTSWATRQDRRYSWLLAVLAAAALLGPVEQAVLHTTGSLNKHVGAGAWFAAIAAGYAAQAFITATAPGRSRTLTSTGCVIALVFPLFFGVSQSWQFATSWPDSSTFLAIFGPLADHSSGRLLVEDPGAARYYLSSGSQWQRWSSTRNIVLPGGASTGGPTGGVVAPGNPAAYARYISQGYFSYVALNFADTTALDLQIKTDLVHSPHYSIVQVIPYNPPTSGTNVDPATLHGTYVVWRYKP